MTSATASALLDFEVRDWQDVVSISLFEFRVVSAGTRPSTTITLYNSSRTNTSYNEDNEFWEDVSHNSKHSTFPTA